MSCPKLGGNTKKNEESKNMNTMKKENLRRRAFGREGLTMMKTRRKNRGAEERREKNEGIKRREKKKKRRRKKKQKN